jgi:hypothetical protein
MNACHAFRHCRFALAPLAFLLLPPANGRADVRLPNRTTLRRVDFERHVMGLLGRLGCNAGACHGSFQGKGGLRLSLFGYEPDKDYAALTHDVLGRRVNPVDPDRSLFLLKATGQVSHGGGRRFGRSTWQYQLLREWVTRGARRDKGSGRVAALNLTPGDYALVRPGRTGRVRVRARFADGSAEDVTPLCEFRVQDDAVAEVSDLGVIRGLRPGDTALVVSYRGNVRSLRVLVPVPAVKGFRAPRVQAESFIDREVFAKLLLLGMAPSGPASDAEFLRRVTIDTIGCLPSPADVRAFLADRSPAKRAKKIEELLAHPLHAALWATKFSDITGNNTNALPARTPQLQARASQMWHDWFRKRLAANVPYDEIVYGVLCATSRAGRPPDEWMKELEVIDRAAEQDFHTPYADEPGLDLYWRAGRNPTLEQFAERTAAAFLGIQLECAQCHKHPFDRWTLGDYRSFANVFGHVVIGASPEAQPVIQAANEARGLFGKAAVKIGIKEVFVGGKGRGLFDPGFVPVYRLNKKGKRVLANRQAFARPKALGGPVIQTAPGEDARAALFDWLRGPDNPYFAPSFVNRVWGHYFGVGLVDPMDNFSQANPPSNRRLLGALARDFIRHRFDIRALERTILNSQVYQLSSEPNATNERDRNNFSHSYLRPMMADVVVDVLNSALGTTEYWGPDAPPCTRAIELGASRVAAVNVAHAFRVFGRPQRTTTCECERAAEPALPQTLYLMADPAVLAKIRSSAFPGGQAPQKPPRPPGKKAPKGLPLKQKGKPQPPAKAKGKPAPPLPPGKPKGAPPPPAPPPAKAKPGGASGETKGPGPVPPKGKGPAALKGQSPHPKVKPKPVKLKFRFVKGFPPQEGRLAGLLLSKKTDNEILEELFLATLSRFPTTAEKAHFAAFRAARQVPAAASAKAKAKGKKVRAPSPEEERREAFVAALWALVNTREFILNH